MPTSVEMLRVFAGKLTAVTPFTLRDEWYFNIRFCPHMEGITSILVAKPSDETRQGNTSSPRGPYPHIVPARGRDEVLAWAVERTDGGRGFCFTGAHYHKKWGNENFRKLVLNALLWTSKMDVPADGVSSTVTEEELRMNLDAQTRQLAWDSFQGHVWGSVSKLNTELKNEPGRETAHAGRNLISKTILEGG
jgi:hypothetical protein